MKLNPSQAKGDFWRPNLYKRISHTYFATLFAISFISVGCSWELGDDSDIDNGTVKLLESVSSRGWPFAKYEYDAQNRITKMIHYSFDEHDLESAPTYNNNTPSLTITHTFAYNSAGDLMTIDYTVDGQPYHYVPFDNTIHFTKNGEKITITHPHVTIVVRDFNANGQPIKYADSEVLATIEYQKGNVSKFSYSKYNSDYLISTSNIAYDNMKSPFFHCKTPFWALLLTTEISYEKHLNGYLMGVFSRTILSYPWLGINNPTTIAYREALGSEYVDFRYTYDKDGYPETEVMTFSSNGYFEGNVFSFSYITK